jgi:hypothetical protein
MLLGRHLRQHFGQQLEREADDVRFAPLDHVDPAQAILVTKSARFSLPFAAGQVIVERPIIQRIHSQPGGGRADQRLASRHVPQAQAAVNLVFACCSLAGLPKTWPSSSATVSQASTRAQPTRGTTLAAF